MIGLSRSRLVWQQASSLAGANRRQIAAKEVAG